MNKITNPTFGSDPEFFGVDRDTLQPVSVIGKLGGSKSEPLDIGNGCSRQEDNVLAEVCIPPVTNVTDFVKHINYAKNTCSELLAKYNIKLVSASSMEMPESELQSDKAKEFGCSSSFCAWTSANVEVPPADIVGNLRSAGFHIHTAWKGDPEDFDLIERFIKNMDKYLGLPSLLIDTDTKRRNIYGKAGDFRFEALGENHVKVEYRTLGGNFSANDELMTWCFNQTLLAIDATNNGSEPEDIIEHIIDTQNISEAQKLVDLWGLELPTVTLESELKMQTV